MLKKSFFERAYAFFIKAFSCAFGIFSGRFGPVEPCNLFAFLRFLPADAFANFLLTFNFLVHEAMIIPLKTLDSLRNTKAETKQNLAKTQALKRLQSLVRLGFFHEPVNLRCETCRGWGKLAK